MGHGARLLPARDRAPGATPVLSGDRMNFVNVIVLPVLVGMGVDSGVHLIHRRRTRPDEIGVLASARE